MRLEALYARLPIFLQNAACGLIGWRLKRSRFGAEFHRRLHEVEQRLTWPEDRLLEYRDRRLREFIAHSAATVPYYRRTFDRLGVDPNSIRTLDDLQQLPILTKAEVQHHGREMASEIGGRRLSQHSSGTTGGGLQFSTTPEARQAKWAVWWRYRRRHGIELGTWSGHFGGRTVVPLSQKKPPFWRYNRPGSQVFFSGYHTSPENLAAYVGELRRRRLPWLHGYPSLLTLLASYVLDSGDAPGYPIGSITVGAENLLPPQKQAIERAFGTPPRQHYGLAEAVANVSECPQGKLHVDEDFAAVEFVPNPDGPGHRIVGTNFTNPATPLLRYDTQDVVTLSDAKCTCGYAGRVVHSVDGRHEDYVVLADGARVGRMDHVFKDLIHVREAQIYQCRVGEITIRVVRGAGYGEADEKQLLAETRQRVGEGTQIVIEYVDALERSARGKLRLVISELQQGRLDPPPDAAAKGERK